jgi:Ca2+-binding RTX toxin-like protein
MPIAIAPNVLVNSTTASSQSNPDITVLSNGRYMVVWHSFENLSLGIDGLDIRGRIYSANGTATGPDFIMNSTIAGGQFFPKVDALSNNRFVVVWHSNEGPASGYDVRARIYNASGSAAGPDFIVNTTTANGQGTPSVTTLADGRFVVTWNSEEGAPTGADIRGRIYSATGVAAGPDFIINNTTNSSQANTKIAALSDGRFVVAWHSNESTAGIDLDIRARIYNANGTASGPDTIINSATIGTQAQVDIAALPNNRFAVTWFSRDVAVNTVRTRIFDSNGTASGPDIIVHSTSANDQIDPSIITLADGRIVVAWGVNEGGPNGSDIWARIYSAAGIAAGKDFKINSTSANDQGVPRMIALSDGRFIATWQSNEGAATGFDVRSATINPLKFTGTNANDSWIGGIFAETLSGGGGKDIFVGNSGNDVLRGESGNDRLSGGNGNDILIGGTGKDVLSGGGGADKFRYNGPTEGGDTITSFVRGADKFVFEGQAFGLGTFSGVLPGSRFDIGNNDFADRTTERFIFNTDTDQLWYDSNGSVAGGTRFMIADISNNVAISAGDILII